MPHLERRNIIMIISRILSPYVKVSPKVLNLFLALLLSSFSADNLSAPDEDGEMNNLQLAFARINRGLQYAKRAMWDFCCSVLRQPKATAEKKAMMKLVAQNPGVIHNCVSNHTTTESGKEEETQKDYPANDRAERKEENQQGAKDHNDDFMTNPDLSICVPIAVGESDIEDDEQSTFTETDQVSVSFSGVFLQGGRSIGKGIASPKSCGVLLGMTVNRQATMLYSGGCLWSIESWSSITRTQEREQESKIDSSRVVLRVHGLVV
ncbi:UNVERIFIED_CONTAM: hypothetical protein K2H54_012511 [Gekko kuhli]